MASFNVNKQKINMGDSSDRTAGVQKSRERIDSFIEIIEPFSVNDELNLPQARTLVLKEIINRVRRRRQVNEKLGVNSIGSSAFFTGASGTGKTLAAEVIAKQLKFDLYRIDLSKVVSKYIGETEKNISEVFDTVKHSDAVLLFDEADALFGKRTAIQNSHDRYANLEVSYLLQKIERYKGLTILNCSLKNAMEQVFLSRLGFVVKFPFTAVKLGKDK